MKYFFSYLFRSIPALVLAVLIAGSTPKDVKTRPNIIYIMADDMGYSDIGCYGGEVHTPNIDRLAANGIKLRSFYNNARCCPTRASLLTGQYPHTVGMGDMVTKADAKVPPGSYQGYLDFRYPTIAEELKKAGYNTYMSGKWHVGENEAYWPLKRGFEHYFGLISGANSYYEIIPQEKGIRHIVQDDKEYEVPKQGFYMTDAITDHAIEYINDQKKSNRGKPFFLYMAYTAPHFPLHAYESDIKKYEKLYEQGWGITRDKRYQKMIKLGLIDKRYKLTPRPANIPAWNAVANKQWVRKMAVYAAMIDRMDQGIGRLVENLKANNQFNNTLIVFISDNGGCAETVEGRNFNDSTKKIGERVSYVTYNEPWANVSNTPFKKYKRFMHEGGMITPFIMQWPAKIKARPGYSEQIGHVIDLLPTALQVAGVKAGNTEGKSLSYVWDNSTAVERTYCWEHEGNAAIRKGNWKLVKDQEDASWELYNLSADPTESTNVVALNKEKAASLLTEYQAWAKRVGVKMVKSPK